MPVNGSHDKKSNCEPPMPYDAVRLQILQLNNKHKQTQNPKQNCSKYVNPNIRVLQVSRKMFYMTPSDRTKRKSTEQKCHKIVLCIRIIGKMFCMTQSARTIRKCKQTIITQMMRFLEIVRKNVFHDATHFSFSRYARFCCAKRTCIHHPLFPVMIKCCARLLQ